MMRQGGDDLDDDFVPDELVALSDGEEPVGGSASDPADDVHGSLSVEEEASDDGEAERKNEGKKEKKRKRREKEKERKAKKRKLTESSDVLEPVESIAAQPPAALYSYLWSKQVKTFSTMSALELGDMQIPDRGVNSEHDEMDRATNARSAGGLYSQGSSHSSYTTVPEIQVQGRPDTYICDWSGTSSRRRDQSSQRQKVTG